MDFKNKLIKSLNGNQLVVTDTNNNKIAFLSIVDQNDINDTIFIQKVTDWRKKFANCFLSVFEPTYERTRNWLSGSLIPDRNRVFCKIFIDNNILVGHIGAINHQSYVELDYIIRGEKVEIKDFSMIVEKRFLKWICEVSGIEMIKARVRSDNLRMINFVKRSGFKLSDRIPLSWVNTSNNELRLVADYNKLNSEIYLIELEMSVDRIIL